MWSLRRHVFSSFALQRLDTEMLSMILKTKLLPPSAREGFVLDAEKPPQLIGGQDDDPVPQRSGSKSWCSLASL